MARAKKTWRQKLADETQKKRLRAEGHRVGAKGRKLVVADHEKALRELA